MDQLVITFIKSFLVFNIAQGMASLCVWIERKGSALIQDRIGANRAGSYIMTDSLPVHGLLMLLRLLCLLVLLGVLSLPVYLFINPPTMVWPELAHSHPILLVFILKLLGWAVLLLTFAGLIALLLRLVVRPQFAIEIMGRLGVINTLVCDSAKAILKEDFVPSGVSNFIHCLAPFLAVLPVFLSFALVPMAPDFNLAIFGHQYLIRPQVATMDAGILVIFAMASMSVYGVVLAGWCSNNKFSLLGALRATAQMISYELSLGIAMATMIVLYGTVDIYDMVLGQQHLVGGILPAWGVFIQPLTFVIVFAAGLAETKRAPFDLPESESELIAGYFTEYSGMKFLLFWLGEFAEIALFAAIMTCLFFGGWDVYGFKFPNTWYWSLGGLLVFLGKVTILCTLQIIIRWTLPRFRYDQVMNLGWKILLPLSLLNLVLVAVLKLAL